MGLRYIAALIAGGIALALAFPGVNLWPLVWVAFVPLLLTLRNNPPRRALLPGFIFGFAFYALHIHWIRLFGYLPWFLLVTVQAAIVALFALLASLIMRQERPLLRMIGVASAWVLVEWLRSLGPAGFTWGSLAYSQAYNLPIARIASVTGPWGVSFLIVLTNAAIIEVIISRERRVRISAIVYAFILTAVYVWGMTSGYAPSGHILKVAAVQPCLPQVVNPDSWYSTRQWNAYRELTKEAVRLHPNYILWPESAMPDDIERSNMIYSGMKETADASGADVITGGVGIANRNGRAMEQNNAYVITSRDGIRGRYSKVRLVPFGEYVPFRKWLTVAKRYGVREVDYLSGSQWKPLDTSYGRVGAVICFESTFPQISRILVNRGAKILFVLTNDGWFEQTSAPEQHMQMSVFRAIENHRYVVRSTTTGISAVIAPDGRITSELDLWKKGIMNGEVEMLSGTTLYSRFGDWLAYLSVVIAVVLSLNAGVRQRHQSLKSGS